MLDFQLKNKENMFFSLGNKEKMLYFQLKLRKNNIIFIGAFFNNKA